MSNVGTFNQLTLCSVHQRKSNMTIKELQNLLNRYDKDDKVTISNFTDAEQEHLTLHVTTSYGSSDILINKEN